MILTNKDNVPCIKATQGRIRALDNNDNQAAAHCIALATERNWSTIKVRGNKEFKQQIWLEANRQSPPIKVEGYTPTEQDLHTVSTYLEANTSPNEITKNDDPEKNEQVNSKKENHNNLNGNKNNINENNTDIETAPETEYIRDSDYEEEWER